MTRRTGGSSDFLIRAMGALHMQKAACAEPRAAQQLVLEDLLSQARGTAFGHDHALRYARTLADWRDAIPVRRYEDFHDYVDRIANGERKVLTQSDPYGFLKTSGTSGAPKYVPTTPHWRYDYRGPALYAQWGLYFHLLGLSTVEPHTAFDLSWERAGERPQQMYGQLPVFSITQRHESLGGADWTPPWYGAAWFRSSADSVEDALYIKLRHLAGKAVRLLVSVNPSKIVLLGELTDRRSDELIRDIRDGTCLGLPNGLFDPDPDLARALDHARSVEGGLRIDHVFPQLGFVVCWTSASAKLYEPWLSKLVPDVNLIPFSTTGTEGIVTLPIDAHVSSGALAVNQGLYEFAEVDNASDTTYGGIVDATNVEVGGIYRLIMSQANGLYRYDTNDLYRVTGWSGATPRVEFLSRVGNVSSFTGEKLTEGDIDAAMKRAFESMGRSMAMYTAVPVWGTPPGYVIALEQSVGLNEYDARELSGVVDEALQEVNIEYREKRATHRLSCAEVVLLRSGALARNMSKKIAQGASPAQVKHHWLQRDDLVLRALSNADEILGSRRPDAGDVQMTGSLSADSATAS